MSTFINFTGANDGVIYINTSHVVAIESGISANNNKWVSIIMDNGDRYYRSTVGGATEEEINNLINSITGNYTAIIND